MNKNYGPVIDLYVHCIYIHYGYYESNLPSGKFYLKQNDIFNPNRALKRQIVNLFQPQQKQCIVDNFQLTTSDKFVFKSKSQLNKHAKYLLFIISIIIILYVWTLLSNILRLKILNSISMTYLKFKKMACKSCFYIINWLKIILASTFDLHD